MNNLVVDAPMGAYNHSVNGSWNASGLNPFFISSTRIGRRHVRHDWLDGA